MSLAADLALISEAAREAGALALDLRARGLDTQFKADKSPVTNADLACDALLLERLQAARPDYGWLSEETTDNPERLGRQRTFVVDPIDGTRAFVKDKPWWAVSIAVVEAGRPTVGAIYAPQLDQLFVATLGGGARLNGQAITTSQADRLEDCAMVGDAEMFRHPAWPEPWPKMRVKARNSIAYRMCLVACGEFDAALALSPKSDWDLAAGDLITAEAGGVSTNHYGQDFTYNGPNPTQRSMVCSARPLASLILNRVRHIGLSS